MTGKVLDRDDHRKLIEDAIGELDFSALEAESSASGRLAPHVRAVALPGRPGRRQARRRPRAARRLRRCDRRGARAPRACSRTPSSTRSRRPACSARSWATRRARSRNFVLLVSEKGRAGEIEEICRELEALVAAEQKRLTVELTTALRAVRRGGRVDPEEDRGVLRPHRRGDAQGRSGADRRHRAPGGLAPRRRERQGPPRGAAPRAGHRGADDARGPNRNLPVTSMRTPSPRPRSTGRPRA